MTSTATMALPISNIVCLSTATSLNPTRPGQAGNFLHDTDQQHPSGKISQPPRSTKQSHSNTTTLPHSFIAVPKPARRPVKGEHRSPRARTAQTRGSLDGPPLPAPVTLTYDKRQISAIAHNHTLAHSRGHRNACAPSPPISVGSPFKIRALHRSTRPILPQLNNCLCYTPERMADTDFDRLKRVMLGEFSRVHEQLDEHDERFDSVDAELRNIRAELKTIRSDLDDLSEKVENILGYRKEIDHALTRIAAIEKHLRIR